ncbi:MAG: ABC transporter permease [Planctomycetota bacterium]|jgi:phospholipid/cholesterol/gamma-HCH transport system permease protein
MARAFSVTRDPEGRVTLVFRGRLDIDTAPGVWAEVLSEVRQPGSGLTLDLTEVTGCDGAGVGLLVEADRAARGAGADTRLVGASDDMAELLGMARLEPETARERHREPNVFEQLGGATATLLATCRALISFIGDLAVALPRSIVALNPPRVVEILRNCTRVGADAVPVVCLLGALVGFILAVQSVKALENIGATSLVPMVVGFATLREFGPLIAAIILAGRSGSAFAAEIGTMKVTEELDAYTTFALDPMVVLVAPRVIAGTLVTPLLAIFSIVLGVLGGSIPMLAQQYSLNAYLTGVLETVVTPDLVQALVKATVFGFIVASLGCFYGLRTGSGPDAVGTSTTRAVVAGIVAVLVSDSILSTIFYNLGF